MGRPRSRLVTYDYMKIEKADLLTPANVATMVGLALTLHGAANLDSLQGVVEVGIGRTLDLVDGRLARMYHASRFGAALDGATDKVAIFAILAAAVHYDAAPLPIIGLIGLHNVTNAAVTLYAEKQGKDPESSIEGKQSTFFENAALGAFALANVVASARVESGMEITGFLTAGIGLALGIAATRGYIKNAIHDK